MIRVTADNGDKKMRSRNNRSNQKKSQVICSLGPEIT